MRLTARAGRRALAGVAAVALTAGLLTSCSSGGGLDRAAVERAITTHARLAYPTLAVTGTRCPANATDTHPFGCTLRTAAAPIAVGVRPAAHGRLTVTATEAVISSPAAAFFVAGNTSTAAIPSCGAAATVVAAPGSVLPCDVTFADGTKQSVQLRVLDPAGDARIEVPASAAAPPAASPGGTVSWSPIGRSVLGRPATFGGQANGVGLAWLDPQVTHPVLVAGTSDPSGSPGPWGGQVAPSARPSLAAAFNSGFKMGDIRGGWVGWGVTWRPPEVGDASLVVNNNGQGTVGQWGRDVSGTPDVAFVRQNLPLLVDGGAPVASAGSPGSWGASVSGAGTWRSALGVDAHGALVFAAGGGITPAALAQALVAAGVQRAMELDINPSWVSFNTYQSAPDGSVHGKAVYGLHGDDRYLSPDSRDFIAVLVRAFVQNGATGHLGSAPLALTMKAPMT